MSDDLLIGVGQNVDPDRMMLTDSNINNANESTPIIEGGAKISLFDVSNINAPPLEISSIVYKEAYTPR